MSSEKMKIALFPNKTKRESNSIAKEIRKFLVEKNVEVLAEDEEAALLDLTPLSTVDPQLIDFVISMGGDGTILRLLHKYPEINAPLLGINLGSLGFMADITINDIYPSLEYLLNGNYTVQNRLIMEGETANGQHGFALNEIVFHRAQNPCLIDLSIHVDACYLNTFSADGIILSTPSGSTAYSLAAGGPILTPELEAFVLTPICPHTISNRPIVLMPHHDLQVQYISNYEPIEVTFDGIKSFSIAPGEKFRIWKSQKTFKLVCLPFLDYFSTLRQKLGWVGKLRSAS